MAPASGRGPSTSGRHALERRRPRRAGAAPASGEPPSSGCAPAVRAPCAGGRGTRWAARARVAPAAAAPHAGGRTWCRRRAARAWEQPSRGGGSSGRSPPASGEPPEQQARPEQQACPGGRGGTRWQRRSLARGGARCRRRASLVGAGARPSRGCGSSGRGPPAVSSPRADTAQPQRRRWRAAAVASGVRKRRPAGSV